MEQATLKNSKKLNKANGDSINTKDIKKKSNVLHTLLLILIIIFLTSIVAIGSIFIFNIAGLKTDVAKMFINVPLVGALVKPLAENKTPLDIEKEQIELEKNELSLQTQRLNEKEKEIEAKGKDLEQKEMELQLKEGNINNKLAQLDSQLQSITEQVEYIEKMDTSKAVQILLNMSEKSSVIQILRNMKKDKAVGIISLMDPLQAAQLLEDLRKTPVQYEDTNKLGVEKSTLP